MTAVQTAKKIGVGKNLKALDKKNVFTIQKRYTQKRQQNRKPLMCGIKIIKTKQL